MLFRSMLNMLGYVIQQDPSPTMVVYPTDKLGESISENRIKPMIKSSPSLKRLFREFQSQKLELQFEGMYLTIAGSNSPSSLASKAIKYLFLDEVDKYPGASRKEADPISLARERTKTFANRKIYMTSTPTFRTGAIWKALEAADVEKHYFVPCPHCGEMIELKFKQIKWPEGGEGITAADRADQAVYVCQECNSVITDQQKDKILRLGEWRIVRENNSARKKIGFWISTLYSPFVRFSNIALEFLNSYEDSEKLQNFTNSWLAEPWEDTKLKMEEEMVMKRRTELPEFIVPDWARLLTAGVDVQETCLYWTIRAWGNYITSQNIAHGQALSWSEIERIMNLSYEKQGGGSLVVSLCLIDSGFDTDSTYDFCVNNLDWALPVKGSSHAMDNHFKVSKINKLDSKAFGMNLVIVDGGKYKDMIAARMHKENGDGAWMVYSTCDLEYAKQVTAEHKIHVKVGARIEQKWQEKYSHAANHYLDCEVYAFAAADIMGVRSMHLEVVAQTKVEEPKKAIEESWIPASDNWV